MDITLFLEVRDECSLVISLVKKDENVLESNGSEIVEGSERGAFL